MASIWEKAISILAGNLNSGRSYLITAVTAAASRCYSFMKSSCVDAKELRPFCYMALCYTLIEDERDRYSMFFIQPQKLFCILSHIKRRCLLESRKNRLDLNKISFQKTCLSKPGQYCTCTYIRHITDYERKMSRSEILTTT